MLKGMGKALQAELAAPGSSALLNSHRRRILEYLCLRPFSTSGRIATDLNLSPSSVLWHLRSLLTDGYVLHRREERLYYPKDFVDISDAGMFVVLHAPRRRDVLRSIMEAPGVTQVEIADDLKISRQTAAKIATELVDLALVTRMQDGRFMRCYTTDLLRERQDSQRARSRAYVESLLRRLEEGGQAPQVLRRTETELQLKIGRGKGRGVLSIPLDPYGALAV